MHQLHILHYEFAQNELKVWYKSLLRLSSMISISSSNSYQTSENLRPIGIEFYLRHLGTLKVVPNSWAGLEWMPFHTV
jgi:hypothetical protein